MKNYSNKMNLYLIELGSRSTSETRRITCQFLPNAQWWTNKSSLSLH